MIQEVFKTEPNERMPDYRILYPPFSLCKELKIVSNFDIETCPVIQDNSHSSFIYSDCSAVVGKLLKCMVYSETGQCISKEE